MRCPHCGSDQMHIVTNTVTREKGFSGCLACIGVLLFNWVGLLCGLCGSGREEKSSTRYICQSCGRQC